MASHNLVTRETFSTVWLNDNFLPFSPGGVIVSPPGLHRIIESQRVIEWGQVYASATEVIYASSKTKENALNMLYDFILNNVCSKAILPVPCEESTYGGFKNDFLCIRAVE